VWLFGNFAKKEFNNLIHDIPHEGESDYIWKIYKRQTKNQASILDIQKIGTKLIGLISYFHKIIFLSFFSILLSLKTLLKSILY